MPDPLEALLTVDQVAEWLSYSSEHVRRLARQGRLPAYRAGHAWRFARAEVEAWLRRDRAGGEGGK